jgi:hypothetical protein
LARAAPQSFITRKAAFYRLQTRVRPALGKWADPARPVDLLAGGQLN